MPNASRASKRFARYFLPMIQLPHEFKEFLRLLNDNHVEYLLIGGWAVGLYGHVRATGDIDFWICPTPDNAERVVNALNDFGLTGPTVTPELVTTEGHIRFGVPPMRIELLMDVDGVEFDPCFKRRETMYFDDVPVAVIAVDDLIANKIASGRHKDLADVEELSDPDR